MSDNTKCHFLALPAELRNRIYEMALEDEIITITDMKSARSTPPGVLIACKQMYTEGLGLFHATATIRSPEAWLILAYLDANPHIYRTAKKLHLTPKQKYDFPEFNANQAQTELLLLLEGHSAGRTPDVEITADVMCFGKDGWETITTATPYLTARDKLAGVEYFQWSKERLDRVSGFFKQEYRHGYSCWVEWQAGECHCLDESPSVEAKAE